MLEISAVRRRGAFALSVELSLRQGETTVLVGESGAGKTTVLRLVAGLDQPDEGRIVLDDWTWLDTATGVTLPAWRRGVGYVFQDYALFPHLTVADNVGFGLRAAGVGRRETAERARATLDRLGIGDLAGRRVSALSGGQQQRVALARAVVLDPDVLLLDEPMSALDLRTRRGIRAELRRLLRGLPCSTLYVTHNPVEAMFFGERLVAMERGRVTQSGTRDDLLRHPRSAYVAELVGTNLLYGSAAMERGGGVEIRTGDGPLAVRQDAAEGEVFATVSPRDITLYRERPEASAQNLFTGPIVELVPEPPGGERVRVALGTVPPLVAEVTREAVAALELREGLVVHAGFKATGVRTYS
ncbi:MAG TPA: ABC transporter ATP-binding protein [Gemmatimonadales bacterium]|nr:ABC transporter ATP-binding protein [Gemmatimonadales bacterium]